MPKSFLSLALALLLTGAAHAASRHAGEFLSLGAGARSAALGSAYVALADDATAGYWNAAGLSALSSRQVHLTHSEHFSGLIQRDFVAIAQPGRLLHGMALSLVRMGIDDIHFTELPDPLQSPSTDNRPRIASTEQSADYALYLSGSRRLGARLSLGLSAKAIYRQVASINAYGFGLDLGARYQLSPQNRAGGQRPRHYHHAHHLEYRQHRPHPARAALGRSVCRTHCRGPGPPPS